MKIRRILSLILLIGLTISVQVFPITFKIGSVAPEQSPWGTALKRMAADWDRITNGKVQLRIYHNGVAGNEADMLRKIRIGQLNGGVFSSYGLFLVSKEILSLSIPFLIRDERELEQVMEDLRPVFDDKVEREGFKIIAWSKAGWIRFFSTKPVVSPNDLKSLKLSTSPDDAELIKVFQLLGFQQVPVPLPDVMASLNSGLIEALYASPIAVGGYQWFGIAKHMAELKIAPFLGGIILSDRSWKSVPEVYREELLESVRQMEASLDSQILQLEDEAIKAMQQYGLVINDIPESARQKWVDEFQQATEQLLGTTFSSEMVTLINRSLALVRE